MTTSCLRQKSDCLQNFDTAAQIEAAESDGCTNEVLCQSVVICGIRAGPDSCALGVQDRTNREFTCAVVCQGKYAFSIVLNLVLRRCSFM